MIFIRYLIDILNVHITTRVYAMSNRHLIDLINTPPYMIDIIYRMFSLHHFTVGILHLGTRSLYKEREEGKVFIKYEGGRGELTHHWLPTAGRLKEGGTGPLPEKYPRGNFTIMKGNSEILPY